MHEHIEDQEEIEERDDLQDEASSQKSANTIDRRSFLTRSTLVAGGALALPLILTSNGKAATGEGALRSEKDEPTLPDFGSH